MVTAIYQKIEPAQFSSGDESISHQRSRFACGRDAGDASPNQIGTGFTVPAAAIPTRGQLWILQPIDPFAPGATRAPSSHCPGPCGPPPASPAGSREIPRALGMHRACAKSHAPTSSGFIVTVSVPGIDRSAFGKPTRRRIRRRWIAVITLWRIRLRKQCAGTCGQGHRRDDQSNRRLHSILSSKSAHAVCERAALFPPTCRGSRSSIWRWR